MTDTDNNPTTDDRLGIGGNNPPLWALLDLLGEQANVSAVVTDYLNDRYKQWEPAVEEILEEARALPREIAEKEDRDKFPPLIKRIRDLAAKLNGLHTKEKEPFFRGGQAVDQKFFGLIDKLSRRSRTSNAGAADVLNARLTDYDNKVLAAEQERRRLEAERLAREAREKREAEEKAALEAEELRLAAERARKPETVEEKSKVADQAEQAHSSARVEATVAVARAEEAHVQTLAKPADIMRTRGDDGTLSTMAQEKYAEVVDRTKLDYAKLGPYFAIAAVEQALRAWAKATDHREAMQGAAVGRRNKSKVL
jgi:hypothetical protein